MAKRGKKRRASGISCARTRGDKKPVCALKLSCALDRTKSKAGELTALKGYGKCLGIGRRLARGKAAAKQRVIHADWERHASSFEGAHRRRRRSVGRL